MDHTYVGINLLEERAFSGLEFKVHDDEDRLYMEEKVYGTLVPCLQDLIQAVQMKQAEEENPEMIRTPILNPIDWLASLLMRNNPTHNHQAATHPYNLLLQEHVRKLRQDLSDRRTAEEQARLAEEAHKREEEARLQEVQRKKEEEEARKKKRADEEERKRQERERLVTEAEEAKKKEAMDRRKRAAEKGKPPEKTAIKTKITEEDPKQPTEVEQEEKPEEEKPQQTEETQEEKEKPPTPPSEPKVETDEEKMERWTAVQEELNRQRNNEMEAFLEWLQQQVEGIDSADALRKLFDRVVEKLAEIVNGVAFYISHWNLLREQLEYGHASSNCSDGMRSGTMKLERSKNPAAPTFQAVDAASAMHLPNVAQSTDLTFLSDFEDPLGPAGDGDMFAGAILGAANQVSAVLSADTLTSNGRTISAQEADIWGAEGAPPQYRPFDDEEMMFMQSVTDALGTAQLNAMTADTLATVTKASNADVLGAFRGAVDALFHYFGLRSNVYISNFSQVTTDQRICTVVAQSHAPDGPHSDMIGKVLSTTNTEPGLAFAFSETSEGTFYIPDVTEEPTVGVYQEAKIAMEGASPPGEKQPGCLLLIAIRDNKRVPVGVLGIEHDPSSFTQKELAVSEAVAKLLGDLMLPLYQRKLMTDLSQQALQWIEANTTANNLYFSLLNNDTAEPFLRYVSATKGQEFLLGQSFNPEKEGVSGEALASEEVILVDNINSNDKIKLWDPSKKDQKKAQAAFVGVKSKSMQGGVLGCDTLDGNGKPLTKEDLDVLKHTAAMLRDIFDEIMEGTVDNETDEPMLAIEKVTGPKAIRFLKKMWLHLRQELLKLTKDQLLEMAGYKAPPETIVTVVRGTCVLLGSKPSKVKEWQQCRVKLKPPILKKISDFDATKKTRKAKFIFTKKLLKGLTVDTVRSRGSAPTSIFYEWAHLSVQLHAAASKIRRRFKQGGLNMLEEMMPMVDHMSETTGTEGDAEDEDTEGDDEYEAEGDEDDGGDEGEGEN